MKVSVLLGERYKNAPADCIVESQALMVRGGYIKQVGSGIYSLFTPAQRIMNKIENIIREEMDAIDGQEVLFPVVMPASLWKESGRFESIGSELLRFKDRGGGCSACPRYRPDLYKISLYDISDTDKVPR